MVLTCCRWSLFFPRTWSIIWCLWNSRLEIIFLLTLKAFFPYILASSAAFERLHIVLIPILLLSLWKLLEIICGFIKPQNNYLWHFFHSIKKIVVESFFYFCFLGSIFYFLFFFLLSFFIPPLLNLFSCLFPSLPFLLSTPFSSTLFLSLPNLPPAFTLSLSLSLSFTV